MIFSARDKFGLIIAYAEESKPTSPYNAAASRPPKTTRIMAVNETRRNNPFFRQMLFIGLLILIGCVIFKQLNFWVGSFLGAITIYVVLRNPMFSLVEKHHWRKWLASLLLVTATMLVLAGFGYIMVLAIGSEVPNMNVKGLVQGVGNLPDRLNGALGVNLIPSDIIERSDGILKTMLTGILNTTYSFAANIFMMLIVLYFMLTSGRSMEARIWAYAPFNERSLCLIKREVKNMIYSNAVGMPVILVLQTLTSTLIYWLLGFGNPFFWGFLTAICGLIPILGTSLVYIPVAIYMAVSGELLQGLILLLYGLVVISNTDNVFRIILLKRVADTHPLIVIFGVILGIPLFGFWGIIFGPLFISGFILLIKIYYVEYGLIDHPSDEEMCKPPVKKVPKHFSKIHQKANQFYEKKKQTRTKTPPDPDNITSLPE